MATSRLRFLCRGQQLCRSLEGRPRATDGALRRLEQKLDFDRLVWELDLPRFGTVRSNTPASSSAVTSACTALTSLPTRRAASRIETGPAPQSTFSNAQRLAVSTRHSSSGVAKLIRADFCGLPDLAAASASAIAIPGEHTSRVAVFIEMPPDIALEMCDLLVL